MKIRHLILSIILLINCIECNKTNSTLFTDKTVNHWEMITTDSIKNIYDRNKKANVDTSKLNQLKFNYGKLFQHEARQCFMETIKIDTSFRNAHVNNCILIERTHSLESLLMYYDLIYRKENRIILCSFKVEPHKKAFKLHEKIFIENIDLKHFIHEARISNLSKNENINDEYWSGDVIVTFFSPNKVEVFPYLSFNFSNNVFKCYNKLIKMH